MGRKIRVAQFGIGVIGRGVTKVLAQKGNMKIVGAIDLANVGQDLGDVAKLGKKLGVAISDDIEGVIRKTKPQVVIHTTSSSLKKVHMELESLIRAKVNVVSSCEELSYPYRKYPKIASRLDRLAKENQVTVVGTGVNPGFLMDAWPLFMTGVCTEVKEIRVSRIQDASHRRIPFQEKIGAGKTLKEFNELVAKGTLRHVGLSESIAMIASGLGWSLDDITETIEPILAHKEIRSDYITVKPGQAAGVKQVGYGWEKGKALITLNFEAAVGAQESYDVVNIAGTPNLEVIIKGGTHGDIATVAMLVNSIPKSIEAQPGLKTMKDLIISALPGK
ncbi:MAG: dihydrodipicolinate reductase [Deltaproteobacteria bacterium]|nr:dihydrodipicolinate reductase [Deltaproteobacteria bacterium]